MAAIPWPGELKVTLRGISPPPKRILSRVPREKETVELPAAGHRTLNNKYQRAQSVALWGHSGSTFIFYNSKMARVRPQHSKGTPGTVWKGRWAQSKEGVWSGWCWDSGHLALTPPPARTQALPRSCPAWGPRRSPDVCSDGSGQPTRHTWAEHDTE